MIYRFLKVFLFLTSTAAVWLPAQAQTALFEVPDQPPSPGCNRSCLDDVLNRYLAAIVAGDPAMAPLATTYRHTENSVVVPLGQGAWQSVTGLGAIQRHYIDEVMSSVVYYGIVMEGNVRAIVSIRLKVDDMRITEGEWFIGRQDDPGMDGEPGSTAWNADNLTNVNPPPVRIVPPEQRSTRDELIYITNSYWDAVISRNPDVVLAHPGCFRDENGQPTIGRPLPPEPARNGGLDGKSDCRTGGTDYFNVVNIQARRWAVVDMEQQVVVASAVFIREPGNFKRRNHFSDVMYVDNGKLRGIYTAMYYVDLWQPVPNWPPFEGNYPLPETFGVTK